jgi:hypothetical protein
MTTRTTITDLTEPIRLRLDVDQYGQGVVRIPVADATPDAVKVGQRLRATWQRIPQDARQTIGRHWLRRGRGSPRITVSAGLDCPKPDGVMVGRVTDDGHCIELCGPVLARMPRRLACVFIGHELAHCWQAAARIQFAWLDQEGRIVVEERFGHWPVDAVERNADETTAAWGFRELEAADEWVRQRLLFS